MTMLLKPERALLRYVERDAREVLVEPLTDFEKEMLREKLQKYCITSFKRRMISSGLMADFDEQSDIENDAYLFMQNILDKFDKSKYKGKIAEHDVPGAGKPKTLEFYFKIYFSGRINFTACEVRNLKKRQGSGSGAMGDVIYDEELGESSLFNLDSNVSCKYNSTELMLNHLKDKSDDFKQFLHESFIEQYSQKELKDKWQGKFSTLKSQLNQFKKEIKKKYSKDYIEEFGS